MVTAAFIPVRGGSKSIPYKSIKPLAGRPLVHWVTEAALACKGIHRVYVASEDPRVREVAARISAPRLHVIDRDPETATDTASTESALLEFASKHEDIHRIVLIQATSPLLTSVDLNGALKLMEQTGADSVVSVTREHRFLWRPRPDGSVRALNYDPLARPRRQDWDGELVENGAFYVSSRTAILASECRISGRTVPWVMAPESAIELDEPLDWQFTEHLLGRRNRETDLTQRCAHLKVVFSDVDGVLTDAGMYYGPEGEALKKFNTRDGMGMALLRKAGLRVALMTGEDTAIVAKRAAKLQLDRVYQGVEDKAATLGEALAELGISPREAAFIGDDINDCQALERVGLAACPADAAPETIARAHYVCQRRGGEGCFRELAELILRHRSSLSLAPTR